MLRPAGDLEFLDAGVPQRLFQWLPELGDQLFPLRALLRDFSRQRLVPDTPLTFDMGMLLNGYCSDMTRTVFYKSCPPKWESIYNIVREAKE